MKIYNLLLFVCILCFFSCHNYQKKALNNPSADTNVSAQIVEAPQDSVIFSFLKWYENNLEELNSFYSLSDVEDSSHIINGRWGDSTIYYSFNYKGSEKLLELLKSSKCLSEKYINDLRDSFKKRAVELDKNKQWDGPPTGFSADLVFNSNETEDIISELRKTTYQLVNSGENWINLKNVNTDYTFEFSLSKRNNKWLIDRIK